MTEMYTFVPTAEFEDIQIEQVINKLSGNKDYYSGLLKLPIKVVGEFI